MNEGLQIGEEILQTGNTTVPERISGLIRDGLCACDVLNPSGKCCLGEVNRTARRLKKEMSIVESCHKEAQRAKKKDAGDGPCP